MALYKVGPKGHYRDSVGRLPGLAKISLPDESKPGRNWTPLDAKAVAAFDKHFKDEPDVVKAAKARFEKAAAPVVTEVAVVEAKPKGGRPSDKPAA